MAYGDGLRRNRCGIWYWRWVVPADVRQVFGAQEVQRLLETASKRDAVRQSLALRLAVAGLLDAVKAGVLMNKEKMLSALALAKSSVQRLEGLEAQDEEAFRLRQAEVAAEQSRQAIALQVHQLRLKAKQVIAQQHHTHNRTLDDQEQRHARMVSMVAGQTAAATTEAAKTKPGPLLSVAIASYLDERLTARGWTPKTRERWQVTLRLLLDGLGDLPINHVTRGALSGLLARLQRLPSNAGKKVKLAGLTFLALTALGGKFGPVLADETVNGHMTCLRRPKSDHRACGKKLGLVTQRARGSCGARRGCDSPIRS